MKPYLNERVGVTRSRVPATMIARSLASVLGLLCIASGAQAALLSPGRVPVSGSIPTQAVSAAVDLGEPPAGTTSSLDFVLPWQDPDGLDSLLSRLYDPADPLYGQYLTPQAFADRFGPDPVDVQTVVDYAQNQGLTVTSVSPNRLLVGVTGTTSAFKSALGVPIHQYQAPNGDVFLAPTQDLSLPPEVASRLLGVAGFGDHTMRRADSPAFAAGVGSGPQSTLTPSDIRHAYQLDGLSADGTGQTLGVVEMSGYYASDVTSYEGQYSLPSVPLQNVLINGFSGTVSRRDSGGAGEAALDIELMAVLAPKASKILIYEIRNGDNAVDLFNRMATDNLAGTISCSWGMPETWMANTDLQAENAVFQQMAAQGQTFFSAAGDSGAYDDGRTLSVDDPSSQPYVTGVGGTTLTLNANRSYRSETTWNELQTRDPGGGGGGVSGVWSLPSWQQGVISTAAGGSTSMRNVPDVSLNSGSPYSVVALGGLQAIGGTSAAAPLWTAFTTLVNQQRAANSLPRIGFLNPSLYKIGAGPRYAADFHDIADNSDNGYYPAVTGYDDATGWGSFIAPALLADLAGNPSAPSGSTSGSTGPPAGDLNGDGKVDLSDAIIALKIAVGLVTPTPAQVQAGDVGHHGAVDLGDAMQVLQIAVGIAPGAAASSGAAAGAPAPGGAIPGGPGSGGVN